MARKCPRCGYDCPLATTVDGKIKPHNGDISFCINCGAANQFKGRKIVPLKESDLDESAKNEIMKIRSAWNKIKGISGA